VCDVLRLHVRPHVVDGRIRYEATVYNMNLSVLDRGTNYWDVPEAQGAAVMMASMVVKRLAAELGA
jgi:hypothetical protein